MRRDDPAGDLPLSYQSQPLLGDFQVVFAPLDPSVLEPDLYLCFGQLKSMGQVEALRAYHVLLSFEFGLQAFQLLRSEDGADTFAL